jgi:hypothetical protein
MAISLQSIPRAASLVARTVVAVACVNFVTFLGTSLFLGGDALGGKIENGLYYLGSHGRYTEVSEQVFEYSEAHARSVEISLPIMFLSLFFVRGRSHKSSRSLSHGHRSESSGA